MRRFRVFGQRATAYVTPMNRITTDIFIAGGGVAGLTAAAAFGTAGFSVLIVEPTPPVTTETDPGADLRTTAFLQPARATLEAAGVWELMANDATPLQVMRIIDASGPNNDARVTADFDAADISDAPFGWNLPNWRIRQTLLARLSALKTVTFRTGVGFRTMLTREKEVRVSLSDNTQVTTKLVIGADGRDSKVRQAADIAVKTTRYGQMALTFAVTHEQPHQNVSTEIHRSGGPFTLVPLPDHNDQPCSAVVWMTNRAEAQRLANLAPLDFEQEATARSAQSYGPLKLVNRRGLWPIISQIADRVSAERTALIAEAAHVMPPIGAQGLNMSLKDIAVLCAQAENKPLGGYDMLQAYQRARHADIALRVRGIDVLNRASMAGAPIAQDLRVAGVKTLHGIAPLRKTLMSLGLGAH